MPGAQLHAPFASAVAIHTGVVPSTTVIWLDASAVPAITGVVSLIEPPDAGLLTTGAAGAVVSTVSSRATELALVFPAASVAVATRACEPSLSAVPDVQLQLPFASAVAVQIVVLPSLTATLLFASAVPLIVGLVLFVTVPETGLVSSGADGGVWSIVKVTAADAGLALPAGSVATAVNVCEPSLSAVPGMQFHAPALFAITVQMTVLPSLTVTLLPASAVPLIEGCEVVSVAPAVGPLMTGATGAVVSIVNASAVETGLALPAASVATAVTECAPSLSDALSVQIHTPLPSVIAVQSVVLPSLSVTLLLASAVPANVGVLSLSALLLTGLVNTGALAGAIVSTIKVRVAGPLLVLAALVDTAAIVCVPWLSGELGVQLHAPLPLVVAVQTVALFSLTRTVVLASAVPLMVGVVMLTLAPLAGARMLGVLTAAVLTVKLLVVATLALPAASVAVTLRVCIPDASAVPGVQLHAPLALAVAVQIVVPPSATVT